MSVSQLPLELLTRVIYNLIGPAGSELTQYVTHIIEFEQIVVQNKQRRSYVRDIELIIQLEPYNVEERAHFETAEEHSRNNEIFSETIQSLLRTLTTWPEDHSGINLSIQAQSPSDCLRGIDYARITAAQREPERDLLDRRFERSYLQISEQSLKDLPPVSVVTELSIVGGLLFERLIQPASSAIIASKLPRLRIMTLILNDNEKRDRALRKHNRDAFASSFHLWPSSVEKFYLEFYNETPFNHSFCTADLVDGKIEDPLSARLRDFSQQLISITLDSIVVAKELFWPVDLKSDTKILSWPKLTIFRLMYNGTTPSGGWYFERNPDEEDDDDEDETSDDEAMMPDYLRLPLEDRRPTHFRSKISLELISEFYISAGRAAQCMPQLKEMKLHSNCAPAFHKFEYRVDGNVATATWTDLIAFKPDERVLQAWRDAAFYHTGVASSLEVKLIC